MAYDERSADLLEHSDHLVIGVSPTAAFSEDAISGMLAWGAQNFDQIAVLTVSAHQGIYTYLGRGYSLCQARRKARADERNIRNRIHTAQRNTGIEAEVWDCTCPADPAAYRNLRLGVHAAHAQNEDFNKAVNHSVTQVLKNGMPPEWQPTQGQLATGREYLNFELPYFLDTPAVQRVPASVFTYIQAPDFYRHLDPQPDSTLRMGTTQGFATWM
ncbi:tRNA-dependent cyclodipeptide synthase [Streptomyces sp. NPDC002564]|uniref:tRNA-dependent cyclodipeptide synthase n=1 Tax=Streptomyces sp. NPDC002564 TaxID=3364649 RepID=UPI0036CD18DD